MGDVFSSFAPFIQDYIYSRGWDELRPMQVEAAHILFETDHHLLLTSSTASGKTEAAFFPILSMLHEDPPRSFGVLYIAPLKSLINDQFSRLEELLDLSHVPVYHWHGDVSASHKSKAIRDPKGILQITPESLESMLMNRSNDIVRLFGDLRYIIIDELHILTGTDRGNQILCQLARIARLIGYHPRRVGLSATVGDTAIAAGWLSAGTGRPTSVPNVPREPIKWRLGAEHFYIQNDNFSQHKDIPAVNPVAGKPASELFPGERTAETVTEQSSPEEAASHKGKAELDPGYEYLYDCVSDRKCLVFSNSREETEYITATLRQIARRRSEPDTFNIHHGNLSASIREEAEMKLKDDELLNTTCATVTLELGIDIGRLERVVQMDAPNTVSNLLQRIGRSGRRGAPPEMMLIFREENPLPNTPLPQLIPWGLLRAVAIIQLYIEERFIEPPSVKKLPFSLLFQQTLSVLASRGEMTASELAEFVLSLSPFRYVPKDDYKTLLASMLTQNYIEVTDERTLIIGMAGERIINSFKFYAVFKDSEDYTVRCESDEIGTITTPPPVGDRFALAGRVWEVEELDIPRKLIYVHPVEGKMEISWPGDFGEIHTKILQRMRQVLREDTEYPYLKPNAQKRLAVARNLARNTGMTEHDCIHLGGYSYCFFPWLGTRSFRTMRKFIAKHLASPLRLSSVEFEGCYYITFKMERGDEGDFYAAMKQHLAAEGGIDLSTLVGPAEAPAFEKYDDYIPAELLRKAYMADRLRDDEIMERFGE